MKHPMISLVVVFFLAPALVSAAESTNPFQRDKVDRAIDRAIQHLVSKQNPSESWINDGSANHTAITALAVLAMASAGHQPSDVSPQGHAMKRALRYVLHPDRQDQDGYFGNGDASRMYGHGIVTLMLAEIAGQTVDDETDQLIRRRVAKAVDLIVKAQKVPKGNPYDQGGWRYTPNDKSSDMSVTVWQLMALRAAKNAGIPVPGGAVDDGLAYVKRCYAPELATPGVIPPAGKHGFGYTAGNAKYQSTSTTAMGLLSLILAGEADSPAVRGAAAYLAEFPPTWGNVWAFYGSYYYAQAMFQVGGASATKGEQVVMQLLLPEQRPDGSWESSSEKERHVGSVFTTSLGVLALSVKYHYLPIYQR